MTTAPVRGEDFLWVDLLKEEVVLRRGVGWCWETRCAQSGLMGSFEPGMRKEREAPEKECDIRIQLPQVSKEHCKIEVNENKEAVLFNLSSANPTQLNGNHFQDPTHLKHGDILTIIDRSFRYYKMHSIEKANELSPFSKLYELMKHEDGTGNVKENIGNETLLEDVFHSRSRRSAVNRAKLTKVEQSEDSKIQGKHGVLASPIPTFEEKKSEKSSSTQNCDIQPKQECEGANQSDFKNIEENEVGKCPHFKANEQSAQHFPESCILSLDYTEKAKCLNKFNITDAFTSTENTLPKVKPSQESTQNYSSPCSRKPRRSSKSRRTGFEIDSLNKMKSSEEMKECPIQVSGQEHESEAKKSPQKRRGTELDFLVQSLGKRKRVSFGGQLSPELFDKRLPPNSPLKKGAIPARLSMPFGNSPRAVLKKAEELSQSVIQGSFERKQYEKIVSGQADSHSAPQRQQCISDPHVASQPSESEETTTQEMHMNSLFSEVKKTVSSATSSLRRSKPCTPRRSSTRGKSGVMGTIYSKRRSGASEANLMADHCLILAIPSDLADILEKLLSLEKNNSLKTPKRKISGHFTTGHANSPAPIVIGKAHTGILNITAQVPKVVINYPLKKHCDLNESFTEKKSVLDVNISSQRAHNQDVISPALEEVSQIPIHDNLMVSLNERNIMGMEEEKLQQESEPVRQLLEIKRLLKTTKERSEPVEVLSGDKRLLRTTKEKSEPDKALSGVKRLLRTPKEKSESVEALSGDKRLLRTPKQKSEPVEALSGVKRLLKTPKQKSKPVEPLSGVKRLLRTPKEKSESVEALSGDKRLLKIPKQKSEPVEALSGVKSLLRTPKEKSESVEVLSGAKRLLRTRKQKPDPVEALSGVKRLFKTPKEKSESVQELSGVKRLLRIPKQKPDPVEALSGVKRLLRTPKKKSELVEDFSGIKRLFKTPKEKSESVEALSGVKRLLRTPKQKPDPVEALSGVKRLLRTPKKKSELVEDFSGIKRLFKTPKEKTQSVEDLSGIKRLLETPEQKSEPVEVFSGIKMLLKTPKQTMEPPADDIYTTSRLSTEEVLKDMIESVTKNEAQIMEDTTINGITEEVKETVKPIEDRGNTQMMSPKQRFEPINNMVDSSQTLKASKPKSMPTDDYLGLQKFMIEPKESFIIPDIDYTGVKEMLDTENDKVCLLYQIFVLIFI
ncbi:Antigen KI-67, partial [Ophiophagus hannah]